MPNAHLPISENFVYIGKNNEERLVVEITCAVEGMVVLWRTTNDKLPDGQRAKGTLNLDGFAKWAQSGRPAVDKDWQAFQTLENARAKNARNTKDLKRYNILIRKR